jgi:hypothetical protein
VSALAAIYGKDRDLYDSRVNDGETGSRIRLALSGTRKPLGALKASGLG